ncbi:hypothetical protein Drorol1_Dr00010502 [Drosera rotundifolia]
MSKKKAFSGSTMTLKDFHGGSIPSDLPLPSAPGVIVRPSDRPGYDRQSSWGSASMGGRSDHWLRPNSSGSMRSFDDKTPFLTNNVNIGRYFDEDERKPLDGLSGTRRAVSDDTIHGMMPNVLEARQDVGRFSGQQSSGWGAQLRGGVPGGAWSGKVVEGGYGVSSSSVVGGNVSQGSGGSYPNAWGVRKEVVSGAVAAAQQFAAQDTVAKFSQASALDKVSSGRWLTKPIHHPADVEVIRQPDVQNDSSLKENVAYDQRRGNERADYERDLVMRAERGLTQEDGFQRVPKDLPGTERVMAEAAERPKLKLLPRTKPVSEPSLLDIKQGNVESLGSTIHAKAGLIEEETEQRFVERPRLNLRPRSQPIESEATADRNRTLFGGARPRELVLKDRGVDDVTMTEDLVQTPTRLRNDVPSIRTETVPIHANPPRYSERIEDFPPDHRIVRVGEKKDQRANGERADAQRKNQRNENWRSGRDGEKHQHQQQQRQQERKPSPETWRRPVEEPKPSPDASGMRFGKAVSAVELATAFSRSVLEPKASEQFPGQRGLPGSVQIPFSRLTGPSVPARSHINGY